MVVEALAPVGGRLALEQRHQAAALHLGGNRHAGGIEEGLGEIEVGDDVSAFTLPGLTTPGQRTEQRRAQRLLEDPALVEPAVLAEVKALVGGVDDDRVVGQAFVIEVLEAPGRRFRRPP